MRTVDFKLNSEAVVSVFFAILSIFSVAALAITPLIIG
jgi:hypothetical protein